MNKTLNDIEIIDTSAEAITNNTEADKAEAHRLEAALRVGTTKEGTIKLYNEWEEWVNATGFGD